MKVLDLSGQQLDNEQLAVLIEQNPDCEELDISGNPNISDLSCLITLPIRVLNISETGVTKLHQLQPLQGVLSSLDISDTTIDDFKTIETFTKLTELRAKRTNIGSQLNTLLALPLQTLELSEVANIDYATLGQLKRVEELYLSETQTTDQAIKHIAQLQHLRILSLACCTEIKDVAELASSQSLQRLYLQDTKVSGQNLLNLAACNSLLYLEVDADAGILATRDQVLRMIEQQRKLKQAAAPAAPTDELDIIDHTAQATTAKEVLTGGLKISAEDTEEVPERKMRPSNGVSPHHAADSFKGSPHVKTMFSHPESEAQDQPTGPSQDPNSTQGINIEAKSETTADVTNNGVVAGSTSQGGPKFPGQQA